MSLSWLCQRSLTSAIRLQPTLGTESYLRHTHEKRVPSYLVFCIFYLMVHEQQIKTKLTKKNVELLRMTSVYWSLTIIERFVEEVSSSSIWRRLLNWVRAIKLYIRVIMNKNKSGPLKSNICWNQIFPQHILTNCGVGNLDCSPLVTVTWKIGQVKPIKS